ncbi:unnamed protein product [Sphagnum tenellum]
MKAEQYLANAIGNDGINEASLDNFQSSFTLTTSLAKRRANVRYTQVVAQLGFIGNMYICNVVASGASAVAAPTTFSFNVLVEHGDGSLQTWDETNPGTVLTDPATVLARAVSRALIQNVVVQADVLDPTPANSIGVLGASKSVPRYGSRYESLAVGPVYNSLTAANSAITVTALYQPASD